MHMSQTSQRIEYGFDLSSTKAVEIEKDGSIICLPVFSIDLPEIYTPEQVQKIDTRLPGLLSYLLEKGVSTVQTLDILKEIGSLWDLDSNHRVFDKENNEWVVWDRMHLNDQGNCIMKLRRWSGSNSKSLVLIHDGASHYTANFNWTHWNKTFPGLQENFELAESIGLNEVEIARYCFKETHFPEKYQNTISLPSDDLAP